jgi:hypothetical protein
MTSSAPIAAIERIEKAMKHVTPGKWGQFHPSFMPEANGTPFSSWDSSHGVSAVADGKHVKRLATFTHADDASYLDAVQPDVMAGILALARQAEEKDARIAALETALKPFAAHQTADGLDGPGSLLHIPDDHPLLFNGLGNDLRVTVTVGDVRRARTLTQGEKQ